MTKLQKLLRDWFDRWRGRYYEGPEPPPRIDQEVRLFAATHREATVEEWKAFATRIAQNTYRDGFTRGIEWNERLWPGPADDPEVLAEAARHNWSHAEQRILAIENQPSPIAGMNAQAAAALQHSLGNARVVALDRQPASPYPRRPR